MTIRTLPMIAAALRGATWAIRPETLEEFLTVIREDTREARGYELGEPSDRSDRVTVRDDIATVAIGGPLFRYANLLTAYCGASSYTDIQAAILSAAETPRLKAIVLAIDSPGGECKGLLDTAEMIYSLRGRVPIIAHVDGQACSAALLLAAAADRIVADPAAMIGCAGAIMGFEKCEQEADQERMVWFTSDRSPRKNASVLEPDGASQMQALINGTGTAYFDALARYRGLDPATVHEAFGLGAVFASADALTRRMIDSIAVAEQLSTQLANSTALPGTGTPQAQPSTAPPQSQSIPRGSRRMTARSSTSMTDQEQDAPTEPAAVFASGDAVRSTVLRDVTVAENDEGTVVEVLEAQTVYAVEFASGTYHYLTESELAAANGADGAVARARVRASLASARETRAVARITALSALSGRVSAEAITAAMADPTQTAATVALAHVLGAKPMNALHALQQDAAGTPQTPGAGSQDLPTAASAASARAARINKRYALAEPRTTSRSAR
jgi:ClpP class serine protease